MKAIWSNKEKNKQIKALKDASKVIKSVMSHIPKDSDDQQELFHSILSDIKDARYVVSLIDVDE